jgi:hypothetical protein
MVLSGGSPQTFGYLLQNLNVVSLVLGVGIPLIPVTVVWVVIVWLIVDRIPSKVPFFFGRRFVPDLVITLGFLLRVTTALLGYLAVIAGSFGLHILLNLVIWLRNKGRQTTSGCRDMLIPRFEYDYALLLAYLVFATVFSAFFLAPTWLPYEMITAKNAKPATGQILSSTEGWTTYLEPGPAGQINVMRTADIESRTPCTLQPTVFAKSIGGLLAQWRDQVHDLPCPN